jgi:hypothetical protein
MANVPSSPGKCGLTRAVSGAMNFDKAGVPLTGATASLKTRTIGKPRFKAILLATLSLFLLPLVCAGTGFSAPALSYALTTTADPALPGQAIQFTETVTNLTTASHYVVLSYSVPKYTTRAGYPAGTAMTYAMGYVAAGTTQVVGLDFRVLSGSQTPPDGSLIALEVTDQTRNASVSRSVTVRSMPAATLALTTRQSPVTPGGSFVYTLTYHNSSTSTLSGAELSLPVPAAASFVSADGGGSLGSNGVVVWTLNTLAGGATGEVNLTLKASSTTGARAPLQANAALRNSTGQILSQSSDARPVYMTAPLSYAITTATDPVEPGQGIQFTITVTNLSTINQSVALYYDVPRFTTAGGNAAGSSLSYGIGDIAPGASHVVSLDFTVLGGSQAPPDGSLITLMVSDRANGALVSGSLTVRSKAASLALSTPQAPLAPGGTFPYTLAYHNGTTSTLSSAQLSLPVPAGATFVSADGGGALGPDGVVRWALGTLAAGATGEVNLNLRAASTTLARTPLLVEAALRNGAGQILAQVSDAKAIFVTPPLSFALTQTTDPAQPGQRIQFTVTVTNLSTINQYVGLYYDVPQFTTAGSYAAGTALTYAIGYIAPGTTQSVNLNFTVLGGSQTPPDGSLINLLVSDRGQGALLSRSVTVKSASAAIFALSTQQGPVAPGGAFAYTLAYHNGSGGTLPGTQLTLPVPVGASFVSADGDGVLVSNGVVHWTLSSLAAGATGEVHLDLKASSTTGAHPPLLLEAAWRNSAGQILARSSDAKAVYTAPPLSYTLTATTDLALSGQAAQFKVTVTNRSSVNQYVELHYDVPQFTTDSGYPAGTALTYTIGYVAPGATQSVTLNFTVLGESQIPPNGSLTTLVLLDQSHGGLVSRTVAVNQTLLTPTTIGGIEIGAQGSAGIYTGYTLAGGDVFTSLSIVNIAHPLNKYFPTIDYEKGTRGTTILLSDSYDSDPYNSGDQDSNSGVALRSNTISQANSVLTLAARIENAIETGHIGNGRTLVDGMIHSGGYLSFSPPAIVEAYVKFSSGPLPSGWHPTFWLEGAEPVYSSGEEWDFEANTYSGQSPSAFSFNYNQHAGAPSGTSSGGFAAFDGKWHLVSMVLTSGGNSLYVDGVLKGTSTIDTTAAANPYQILFTNHIIHPSSLSDWKNTGAAPLTYDVNYYRIWIPNSKYPGEVISPRQALPQIQVPYNTSMTYTFPTAAVLWGSERADYCQTIQFEDYEPGCDTAFASGYSRFPAGLSYNSSTRILSGITTDKQPGRLHTACMPSFIPGGGLGYTARGYIDIGPTIASSSIHYSNAAGKYNVYPLGNCGDLVPKDMSVSRLPSGLSYNSSSFTISGTTATGDYTISMTVTNSSGQTVTDNNVTLTVGS